MVNTKNREFAFPMVNAVFFNLHLPWFMHGCFGFVFAMVNARATKKNSILTGLTNKLGCVAVGSNLHTL